MDHVCRRVEQSDRSAVDDFAFFIYEDEVRGFDEREGDAEGIHPERCRVYRILMPGQSGFLWTSTEHTCPQSNVSSHALVESIFPKDPEGGCELALQICTLFVRVVELGGPRKLDHFDLCRNLVESRLVRSNIGRLSRLVIGWKDC